MRLCTCLTLALVTAAALASGPTVALAAVDAPPPTCVGADSSTFPIRTRIHGGPARYVAGGGFRTWALELTNTTSRRCENIHPVVVLADTARTLKRTQPQLEFYEDAESTTSRPVTFEATDSDELVGVIDEDGPGFTVPPGRTLTVKVRLSLTSDTAAPNAVVANAAVVQRQGGDSEWVGESNDYQFKITDREDGEEADKDGEKESPETTEDERKDESEGGVRDGQPYADELAESGVRQVLPYGIGLLLLLAGGLLVGVVRKAVRKGDH
ncbi:cell wall protein [Streptomyces tailanensis]|uniref:cell wall protein n=1 Tax=Streptomyces tailanensis TaxID=2569858 RepID=UPI00122DE241|nr:cell wall protein [Streptomyces tailanensis]